MLLMNILTRSETRMWYRNKIGCLSEMMTDRQFKQQLEYITRNFDKITYAQRGLKKDLITAEINKIMAEREA